MHRFVRRMDQTAACGIINNAVIDGVKPAIGQPKLNVHELRRAAPRVRPQSPSTLQKYNKKRICYIIVGTSANGKVAKVYVGVTGDGKVRLRSH